MKSLMRSRFLITTKYSPVCSRASSEDFNLEVFGESEKNEAHHHGCHQGFKKLMDNHYIQNDEGKLQQTPTPTKCSKIKPARTQATPENLHLQ